MTVFSITGYKPHEVGIFNDKHPGLIYIKKALRKNLIQLIENCSLEWVLVSGQLGVELWAAEVTLELQEDYPDLKLAIITPFLEQEKTWKDHNREYYQFILSQADFVDSVTKRTYENPSQYRLKNQFFMEKSNGLVIFYDEERGGTPKYMLDLAVSRQMKDASFQIVSITPYDIEVLAEEERMDDSVYWSS